MTARSDASWMQVALAAAERARALDEVPVGAALVVADHLVVAAHNTRELDRDPTAHAEVVALRRAARILGRWRLDDATLFVTLEPCAMCAGALVNARLGRLVYAADDARAGAVRSLFRLADDPRLNHRVPVTAGVLRDAAGALLRDYFKGKRPDPNQERFMIRAAQPGDGTGLARVAVSAVRAAWSHREREADVEARVRGVKQRDWERLIAEGSAGLFVCTRAPSGAIVAYASVDASRPGLPDLEVAVLRELRRRGLGGRLIEALKPWAEARWITAVRAIVPALHAEARAFLEAIGGVRCDPETIVTGVANDGTESHRAGAPEAVVAYCLCWGLEAERREGDSKP